MDLRRWRIERGLSQRQAVALTGISRWCWQQIEMGRRPLKEADRALIEGVSVSQPDEWGPWLRMQRHILGLTQHDLAVRVGISERTVRRWENSTRPQLRLRWRLAQALHVSLSEIHQRVTSL